MYVYMYTDMVTVWQDKVVREWDSETQPNRVVRRRRHICAGTGLAPCHICAATALVLIALSLTSPTAVTHRPLSGGCCTERPFRPGRAGRERGEPIPGARTVANDSDDRSGASRAPVVGSR